MREAVSTTIKLELYLLKEVVRQVKQQESEETTTVTSEQTIHQNILDTLQQVQSRLENLETTARKPPT